MSGWHNTSYMCRRGLKVTEYAQWYQPTPLEIQVHDIQPGDGILINMFLWKYKLELKWEAPYYVPVLLLKV